MKKMAINIGGFTPMAGSNNTLTNNHLYNNILEGIEGRNISCNKHDRIPS